MVIGGGSTGTLTRAGYRRAAVERPGSAPLRVGGRTETGGSTSGHTRPRRDQFGSPDPGRSAPADARFARRLPDDACHADRQPSCDVDQRTTARSARARAGRRAVRLRVAHTESRGHAAHLAAAAADSGAELIVVHGGDGTVNEVVNGLMYRRVRPRSPCWRSCRAGRPTSSPARSGSTPTRRWPPNRSWRRCAASPRHAGLAAAGPTTATSPSTPGSAWTPRPSTRWRNAGTPAVRSRTSCTSG